jgi:hypothetical protein
MIEKSDVILIDKNGNKSLPEFNKPSWTNGNDIILYFKCPDDSLYDYQMMWNNTPIENFIESVTKSDDIYIYKIHIPNKYESPGTFKLECNTFSGRGDLTDERGEKFRSLRHYWGLEKCIDYLYRELEKTRFLMNNICKI